MFVHQIGEMTMVLACRNQLLPFDHVAEETKHVKYMMFIKHSEADRSKPVPPGLLEAMGTFVQEGLASGRLKDTAGLKPTADGARVRLSRGKISVTDGPFIETKEVIGGFAIVEVKSHEEAMEVARQFMELHRVHWPTFEGECEVRPFEDM